MMKYCNPKKSYDFKLGRACTLLSEMLRNVLNYIVLNTYIFLKIILRHTKNDRVNNMIISQH